MSEQIEPRRGPGKDNSELAQQIRKLTAPLIARIAALEAKVGIGAGAAEPEQPKPKR